MPEANPFASPTAELGTLPPQHDARLQKAARALRRVASWTVFFGSTSACLSLWMAWTAAMSPLAPDEEIAATERVAVGLALLAALWISAGLSLWSWRPRARTFVSLALIPALPLFPFGTGLAVQGWLSLRGEAGTHLLRLSDDERRGAIDETLLDPKSALVPLLAPLVMVLVPVLMVFAFAAARPR